MGRCTSVTEPVQSIQGSSLAALGKRREIEHRIGEIIDGTAMRHERLADVDQFACTFTNDVDAQQLAGIGAEQNFQPRSANPIHQSALNPVAFTTGAHRAV